MRYYENPSVAAWAALCERPRLDSRKLDRQIAEIFARVQSQGDAAVLAFTKEFDKAVPESLILETEALGRLAANVPDDVKAAIDMAYVNIRTFHAALTRNFVSGKIIAKPGVVCWQEARTIEKVGLYIPGGTAPLISTALMLGVPAQLAGCQHVVICTPPNADGSVNPAICYAAQKVGATRLVRAGGAQAVAALALGTASIPKVDKIFGPGNQYVTAAKQYAARYGVAIDIPAGPSEIMVIADSGADPAFAAADLLSQAEHGSDSQVVLVTINEHVAKGIQRELASQLETLPRKEIARTALANSFCVRLESLEIALAFANAYAPEHLILNVKRPAGWAHKVNNAGSVFLGNYSPESAGDYASGTNHTLPTNGWARSYGGVSVDSFVKKLTFQELTKQGLRSLAPTIETLARAEGLEAHARAARIRLENQERQA